MDDHYKGLQQNPVPHPDLDAAVQALDASVAARLTFKPHHDPWAWECPLLGAIPMSVPGASRSS